MLSMWGYALCWNLLQLALDKSLVSKNNVYELRLVKIGVAVIDEKNCIAYSGLRCDVCYRACPFIDEALYLKYERNDRTQKHAFLLPVINSDICTGCGKCESVCITKNLPLQFYQEI